MIIFHLHWPETPRGVFFFFFVFLVFGPQREARTAAPGRAHGVRVRCTCPGHPLSHCGGRGHGIFERGILVRKQGTALGWHRKTVLPESPQSKGDIVAGEQFKESSEAGHWRSQQRYTLATVAEHSIDAVSYSSISCYKHSGCSCQSDWTHLKTFLETRRKKIKWNLYLVLFIVLVVRIRICMIHKIKSQK